MINFQIIIKVVLHETDSPYLNAYHAVWEISQYFETYLCHKAQYFSGFNSISFGFNFLLWHGITCKFAVSDFSYNYIFSAKIFYVMILFDVINFHMLLSFQWKHSSMLVAHCWPWFRKTHCYPVPKMSQLKRNKRGKQETVYPITLLSNYIFPQIHYQKHSLSALSHLAYSGSQIIVLLHYIFSQREILSNWNGFFPENLAVIAWYNFLGFAIFC